MEGEGALENGSLKKYISCESELQMERNQGEIIPMDPETTEDAALNHSRETRALYRRRSVILALVQTMCGVIILTFDLLQYVDIPSSKIWLWPFHAFWIVPCCLVGGIFTFAAAIKQHKITYTICTASCLVAGFFALAACILNIIKMLQIYEAYEPSYKADNKHEQFVLEFAILAVRLFIVLLELVAALVQAAFHPLTCCPMKRPITKYPPYEDESLDAREEDELG